jgi:peptidoglycan hydrolase CwlO-like protein
MTTTALRTFALVGLLAGLGVTGLGLTACQPEKVEVMRDPTDAEIAAKCAPIEQMKDELTAAQTKVSTLEREAAEKEGKVRELEARISKGAKAGGEMRQELERLKLELADTKQKLAIAEAEKERVLVELTQTKEELAQTKEELVQTKEQRDQAREDALYNRWQKFLAAAQLEICDKGNRKKLGGCREAVTAALASKPRQDKFAHCIRSGQAQPLVHELEKDAKVPQYGEMMDEEIKQVKGWYVEFCDPTLPEKEDADLAEKHLEPSAN